MPSFQERRESPRKPCLISAHMQYEEAVSSGTLLNISERGSFLATATPVPQGSEVRLRFRHPRTQLMVLARAMVARHIPDRSGQPGPGGLGLQLLDSLSDLERKTAEEAAVLTADWGGWTLKPGAPRARPKSSTPPPQNREHGTDSAWRQRSIRIDCRNVPIYFSESTGPARPGKLVNFSVSGLSVSTPLPPPQAAVITVELRTADNVVVPLQCEVVWQYVGARGGGFGGRIYGTQQAQRFERLLKTVIDHEPGSR